MSTLRDIVQRLQRNGRTVRVLDCGHEQLEVPGGRASVATRSHCVVCDGTPAPVLGVCTAIVLPLATNKAQPCGKPAKHVKRGEPRCGYHFHRGTPEAAS